MAYLLNANVLICAKRDHYRFRVCPGFWKWIEQAHQAGTVFSIDKVWGDLAKGNDPLATWAGARPASFFLTSDSSLVAALESISAWVDGRAQYTPQAKDEFFSAADYFLVAHALAKRWKVVTHEKSAPESRNKIKIPDVCVGVGVTSISPFKMLEDEGAKFILAPRPS